MLALIEHSVALPSDPLWRFLRERLRITTHWRAILFACVVGATTTFVIPVLTGYLFPRSGIISALEDWPSLLINFLTAPLIYSFYCVTQPDAIHRLAAELTTNATSGDPAAGAPHWGRQLGRQRWFALIGIFTVAGALVWAYDSVQHGIPTYYTDPPLALGANILRVALAFYMVLIMVGRQAIVTLSELEYFRDFPPAVHAFHPDRSGGLAFLGAFSLRGTYLIAICALNLSMILLHNARILHRDPFGDVGIVAGTLAYVVLAPLFFVLPLIPAHSSMRKAKISAEKLIADEAYRLYHAIQRDLQQGELKASDAARLEDINRLRKLTAEFPVWPLDIATVGRFVTIIVLPVWPLLIIRLLEALQKWLGG